MLTQNIVPFARTSRTRSRRSASGAIAVRDENLNVIRRAVAAYLSSFPAATQESALLYAVDIIVAELLGQQATAIEHDPSLDPAS